VVFVATQSVSGIWNGMLCLRFIPQQDILPCHSRYLHHLLSADPTLHLQGLLTDNRADISNKMSIDNVEVEILIDGEAAPEYDDPNDDQSENPCDVTKHIEAMPGANFAIKTASDPAYKFTDGTNYLKVKYMVDGINVQGKAMTKEEYLAGGNTAIRNRFISKVNGRVILEKFKFGALQTSDESSESGSSVIAC
jgi:hypothetical protein